MHKSVRVELRNMTTIQAGQAYNSVVKVIKADGTVSYQLGDGKPCDKEGKILVVSVK